MTPTRGGFIVLHRKVLESRMATLPGSQFALAILMLLEANWKPSVIRWGGTERILQRGQLILSERGISERYGCDRQTIRDCLDALRRQETITTERTQHGTIVTWVNYLKYQDVDWQEEPTHPTTHPTTDPTTHPTDHNKGTRKQGNKKARQPSVDAALAASAIAATRQYAGQVSKRPIDQLDITAIRRAVKAGVAPERVAALAYVGFAQEHAFSVAQILSAGWTLRMEKHGSLVQHHSSEVCRRFGDIIGGGAMARAPRPVESDQVRIPEARLDLDACQRAVESLGREAGFFQDNPELESRYRARVDGQEDPVGEPGTVLCPDVRDVRIQASENPPADARSTRQSALPFAARGHE